MGWHSDNEKELGVEPVICVLSFGATRDLLFRKIGTSKIDFKLEIKGGSLLVMKKEVQNIWQHSLPKRAKAQERISLTFRQIFES
jgi:alkylated DNA repair dioxygenase AlkB